LKTSKEKLDRPNYSPYDMVDAGMEQKVSGLHKINAVPAMQILLDQNNHTSNCWMN